MPLLMLMLMRMLMLTLMPMCSCPCSCSSTCPRAENPDGLRARGRRLSSHSSQPTRGAVVQHIVLCHDFSPPNTYSAAAAVAAAAVAAAATVGVAPYVERAAAVAYLSSYSLSSYSSLFASCVSECLAESSFASHVSRVRGLSVKIYLLEREKKRAFEGSEERLNRERQLSILYLSCVYAKIHATISLHQSPR